MTQDAVSPAIASLGGIESFREGGDRLQSQSPSFPAQLWADAPSTALCAVPLPRAKRGGG